MKKAGLVTFYYAHHYGAQLQAYALMKTIEKNEQISCDIVDYVRTDTLEASRLFQKVSTPRTLLKNAHTLLYYLPLRRRSNRFKAFIKDHMSLSPIAYRNDLSLKNTPPPYDMYICGSDQIWNPMIYTEKTFDEAFFMSFTKKKKIAYAPSFGISSIPEEKKSTLVDLTKDFHRISVREDAGAEIIKDTLGMDVPVVLDPTLLLTKQEWMNISQTSAYATSSKKRQPYMLCYFVSNAPAYFEQVKKIKEITGLHVVWLCGARNAPSGFEKIYDAGPKEFLSLFADASFVCTNSFHGTVFSTIFEKEFLSFSNTLSYKGVAPGNNKLNSRIHTLLQKIGLSHRIMSPDTPDIKATYQSLKPIDYSCVHQLLSSERDASLAFLTEAINTPAVIK